jgi:hypothetical protein
MRCAVHRARKRRSPTTHAATGTARSARGALLSAGSKHARRIFSHRVAIANSRLIACDERGFTFHWKDHREQGRTRYKTMTLRTDEFMRRFLLHVLPSGFHRIRHYGLLANATRQRDIATARDLLHQPAPTPPADPTDGGADHSCPRPTFVCRHCDIREGKLIKIREYFDLLTLTEAGTPHHLYS